MQGPKNTMLKFVLLLLFLIVLALFIPPVRSWALEELKAFSDVLTIMFLRVTSQFESELTEDGRAEQKLWRERQRRNLRGLALRSAQKRRGQGREPAELS